MLELSQTAQDLITRAFEKARALGHAQVEVEHLLLALGDARMSTTAKILADAGLDWGALESTTSSNAADPVDERTPQRTTSQLKHALLDAQHLASDLDASAVEVEHICLAIAAKEDSQEAALLRRRGVDLDVFRVRLLHALRDSAKEPRTNKSAAFWTALSPLSVLHRIRRRLT